MAWGIEVGNIDVCRRGEVAHAIFVAADDGSHRALGGVASQLHRPSTLVDKPEPGCKIKRAGCRMRGELAERKPRRRMEFQRWKFGFHGCQAGEAVHVERGLADGGFCQLFCGAFENDIR